MRTCAGRIDQTGKLVHAGIEAQTQFARRPRGLGDAASRAEPWRCPQPDICPATPRLPVRPATTRDH